MKISKLSAIGAVCLMSCAGACLAQSTSPLGPIADVITNLPTVPLNQAQVIVDIGTVSQDTLWNNIRADYEFGSSATNTNATSKWFAGVEVRNNLDTIGGIFAQAGYGVFYHDVQFAPTVSGGYSFFHHAGEIDALPLYLRYNLTGSASLAAGAGWYWNVGGSTASLLYPKSGKTITAAFSYAF